MHAGCTQTKRKRGGEEIQKTVEGIEKDEIMGTISRQ